MARLYSWADLARSAGIAMLVGTVLVLINEGPSAFSQLASDVTSGSRVALNYAVPFVVASVSCLLANRRMDRSTRRAPSA